MRRNPVRASIFFLSYSREDAERIRGIASELHKAGLPIWYDDGLIPGSQWENEILNHVISSRITVFFLSKDLFMRSKTYMHDEFQFAVDYRKPTLCIWLDDIAKMDCTSLPQDMYLWWKELKKIHSIEVFHLKKDTEKAREILDGVCRRDSGFRKYRKDAQNETASSVSQPEPENKPVAAAKSKQKKQKQGAKAMSVRRKPIIITVAAVLVVAIVAGIWAVNATKEKTGGLIMDSAFEGLNWIYHNEPLDYHYSITFGNYKQGADGEVQPVEWRVLAVKNGKALVISEKLLDCVRACSVSLHARLACIFSAIFCQNPR